MINFDYVMMYSYVIFLPCRFPPASLKVMRLKFGEGCLDDTQTFWNCMVP